MRSEFLQTSVWSRPLVDVGGSGGSRTAGDAPDVVSREATPGHRKRGPMDGEQWVAYLQKRVVEKLLIITWRW